MRCCEIAIHTVFINLLFSTLAWCESPPNIILIVADDLNCFIQPYGDTVAKTPNLSRLADRGLVFERAYCQQAVCNPSRSSFLTGMRPDTVQVDDLRKYFRETTEYGKTIVTLPQFFKNRGYFCQNIGKMFHNMGDTQDRQSWSIDEVLHKGTHSADTLYYNTPKARRGEGFAKAPVSEAKEVADLVYRDGQIANLACSVLREYPDQGSPFFLAVGFWRPHLPFVAPKRYWDLYERDQIKLPTGLEQTSQIPSIALHESKELWSYGNLRDFQALSDEQMRHLRHGYYASISFLDAQVGKILDALDEGGHADDTIIAFISDHGFHVGERGLWGKTSNFELDARVPFIIADPRAPRSHGKKTAALCELVDLYPTLVSRCGFEPSEPNHLQGSDLGRLFNHPQETVKDAAYTQHPHPFYRPRDQWEALGYSVRTEEWRYTEWRSPTSDQVVARELYQHDRDSEELMNVAALYPKIVAKHSLKLAEQFPLVPQKGKSEAER